MGKKMHDITQVALFGFLVVVVAVVAVFGVIYLRRSSDDNHDAVRMVRACFNTVQAGNPENVWAGLAPATQDASSLDLFRERVQGHPAFGDVQEFDLAVDDSNQAEVVVTGTVTTGSGTFDVRATGVPDGSSRLRLASLSVDGAAILP